jgi:hypothetical protein
MKAIFLACFFAEFVDEVSGVFAAEFFVEFLKKFDFGGFRDLFNFEENGGGFFSKNFFDFAELFFGDKFAFFEDLG